jgi:hypothetical protein
LSAEAGFPPSDVKVRVDEIGETLRAVYTTSQELGVTPLIAAETIAADRLQAKMTEVQ